MSEEGYPVIKANAPDLFNPQAEVKGRTEINGYSLNFSRDGDTYTLTSVAGAGKHAQNLNQFQKRPGTAWGTEGDIIWTNQFWPMDASTDTFGTKGHDPKFGTEQQQADMGLIRSDDGAEHNSFFGMTLEIEIKRTHI